MINAANAAALLFGVWIAFSFGLAPLIGRMMSERRRARVRVVATRTTHAKPVFVRHIRSSSCRLPVANPA